MKHLVYRISLQVLPLMCQTRYFTQEASDFDLPSICVPSVAWVFGYTPEN